MGQRFNKPTSGGEDSEKTKELMNECYEKHLKDKECSPTEFYRAICDAVGELNRGKGYTQVRLRNIDEKTLRDKFERHCQDKKKPKEEEFVAIMKELEKEISEGLTGTGMKDPLLYTFGVPAAATFIKNAIMPSLVSNEVLIPSMTSLTVLVLAKLNKI